jgi:hypothetical protein
MLFEPKVIAPGPQVGNPGTVKLCLEIGISFAWSGASGNIQAMEQDQIVAFCAPSGINE